VPTNLQGTCSLSPADIYPTYRDTCNCWLACNVLQIAGVFSLQLKWLLVTGLPQPAWFFWSVTTFDNIPPLCHGVASWGSLVCFVRTGTVWGKDGATKAVDERDVGGVGPVFILSQHLVYGCRPLPSISIFLKDTFIMHCMNCYRYRVRATP